MYSRILFDSVSPHNQLSLTLTTLNRIKWCRNHIWLEMLQNCCLYPPSLVLIIDKGSVAWFSWLILSSIWIISIHKYQTYYLNVVWIFFFVSVPKKIQQNIFHFISYYVVVFSMNLGYYLLLNQKPATSRSDYIS